MKKENITISMEADKLRATRRYMGKKDSSMEQELSEALQKLYEKYVPAPVREYIDEGGEDIPVTAKKQKEKSRAAAPVTPQDTE
ncbi:DUF6103 family protein [Anaerotruncus rubiinfantis]|uniref:DUF6103 family protein n=1 Tax=Anaerotruncus rubiinfantis TaxID=1720200 RepID=UPI000829917F|nr:DUF6103 family protein [Anaerotruncus rubiinfantis]